MDISNVFLALEIAYEDGPAVKDFIDELNSNPKCVAGIKAIEHALNKYHSKASRAHAAPATDANYQPAPGPSSEELHTIVDALQGHAGENNPNAAGNPDSYSPGGSQGVAP